MTRNEKVGGLALLLWWWSSSSSKTQAQATKAPEAPPQSTRPEASKVELPPQRPVEPVEPREPREPEEPEEPIDDGANQRLKERLQREKEERAARKKGDHPKPHTATPPGPKAKRPLTKEESSKREALARKFAAKMQSVYLERGYEVHIAAAEAFALYLLAGGSDHEHMKEFQHQMGIPESGNFDISTQTKLEELLDGAVVMACDNQLRRVQEGEDPSQVAAESLALYVMAQQEAPDRIPLAREKLSALQLQFMTAPSGRYDDLTKDALVKHGITPP